ncbi:MAG: DUF58 domain-containing protein [Fusicatenibacter sp.]
MLIILLAGVFLAWRLERYIEKKNWEKNLSVEVRFTDASIYDGESSALKEIVVNDKWLSIPALEVRLAMSRNLEFAREAKANSSVTDQSYKRDIFSFLFRQQITRTLPFVGKRRGLYTITSADVVGYGLFFSDSYYVDFPQQTQLYVYPGQVDVNRIRLICRAVSGMVISRNKLYPDPFEFFGIRDYRKEDPMNHINWKASARTGKLMVNEYDATTNIQVILLLDVQDENILKEEDLVEESIRIASSLSARLVRQKMDLVLKSNGRDRSTDADLAIRQNAGAGRMMELNQKLACLETGRVAHTGEELILSEAGREHSGCTFVVISKNQTDGVKSALQNLAGRDNQALWVVPVHPSDDEITWHAPGVTAMRWEVEPWK